MTKVMNHDRLSAFFDAVLAIIMTILVLELEQPKEPTWRAIIELWHSYAAYALSFFWLGTMWVGHHDTAHEARKISIAGVWWTIILLFASSFFPYATIFVSGNFFSSVAQAFYGIVVIAVTVCNIILSRKIQEANPDEKHIGEKLSGQRKVLIIDVLIKILGLILSLTVFPPAMMIAVFVTVVLVLYTRYHSNERK